MENSLQNRAFWLKIMRVSITQALLLVIFSTMTFALDLSAQEILNKKVSLNLENREVSNVLQKLEQITEIKFVFSPQVIKANQKVSVNYSNEKFSTVLENMFRPLHIKYEISGKYITLSLAEIEGRKFLNSNIHGTSTNNFADGTINGTVRDASGAGIPGVSVLIKGTNKGTATDRAGNFSLTLANGSQQLIFSGIGYKKIEKNVVMNGQNVNLEITMLEDNLQLDQVVVTSSGTPKSKLESSVAVTSISAKQIEQRPPLNSMDLLKAIPGLSVESSGGDGPGAVRVRGLPAGSFAYMGVMEDGTALLPTGFITTPSADQFYKVDLTIKNIEAVRGGEAAMILPSTGGALMNIISNTGGERLEGKVRYTRGLSQNANRFDFNLGGPLAPKWKFNIGAFYRMDDGIKPANYTGNQGGQIKANLTYQIKDNSYIRFYGKYLNDRVAWLVPSYYSYDGSGNGLALPYFDPLTQTLATQDYKVSLTHANGKTYNFDLSDGVHSKVASIGAEFKYVTKNEWTIRNNMKYQDAHQNFTSSLVTAATAYKSTVNYYYLDGTKLNNPTGYYTGQSFGGTVLSNKQFINNLDFSKQIGKNSLSFGANLHTYNVDLLAIAATFATELSNNPKIIKIGSTAGNGFANTSISGYQKGSETITSGWVNDEFSIGNLNIDLGLRADNFNVKGDRLINTAPFTNVTPFNQSKLYTTETIGLNYKLNDHQAIFGRATKTYSALNITDYSAITFNAASIKNRDVTMAEVGYKVNASNFSIFTSLIYAKLANASALMLIPDKVGGFINMPTFASSRNLSAEIEAIYNPTKNLSIRWVNTFQNSKYTDFSVTAPANAKDGIAGNVFSWAGNSPERIPNVISALSLSYAAKYWGLFTSYRYIGKRWSSQADIYRMQGYNETSAGLDIKPSKNLAFRIWGDNLLNSRGLTEGNIRGDQFLANGNFPIGSPQIGRIILPRSIWASITYIF